MTIQCETLITSTTGSQRNIFIMIDLNRHQTIPAQRSLRIIRVPWPHIDNPLQKAKTSNLYFSIDYSDSFRRILNLKTDSPWSRNKLTTHIDKNNLFRKNIIHDRQRTTVTNRKQDASYQPHKIWGNNFVNTMDSCRHSWNQKWRQINNHDIQLAMFRQSSYYRLKYDSTNAREPCMRRTKRTQNEQNAGDWKREKRKNGIKTYGSEKLRCKHPLLSTEYRAFQLKSFFNDRDHRAGTEP